MKTRRVLLANMLAVGVCWATIGTVTAFGDEEIHEQVVHHHVIHHHRTVVHHANGNVVTYTKTVRTTHIEHEPSAGEVAKRVVTYPFVVAGDVARTSWHAAGRIATAPVRAAEEHPEPVAERTTVTHTRTYVVHSHSHTHYHTHYHTHSYSE